MTEENKKYETIEFSEVREGDEILIGVTWCSVVNYEHDRQRFKLCAQLPSGNLQSSVGPVGLFVPVEAFAFAGVEARRKVKPMEFEATFRTIPDSGFPDYGFSLAPLPEGILIGGRRFKCVEVLD